MFIYLFIGLLFGCCGYGGIFDEEDAFEFNQSLLETDLFYYYFYYLTMLSLFLD
jgi:hypothetical protein